MRVSLRPTLPSRAAGNCPADGTTAQDEAFTGTFLRIENQTIPDIYTDGAFRAYGATAAETLFSLFQGKDPNPTQIARTHELEERLDQAILELKEPYRTPIELHYICQMSHSEIAETGRLRSPAGGSEASSWERPRR